MNIYNIFPKTERFRLEGLPFLPKEIWIVIILQLPCKYISNLYNVDDQFKNIIMQENLIKKI